MTPLNISGLNTEIIALINGCDVPLYRIRQGSGSIPVLLSGIVHGDEEAGGHAILEFLRTEANTEKYKKFNFTAYPCVNPWGFINENRYNSKGENINREFKVDSKCFESTLLMSQFENYEIALDLHETWTCNLVGDSEPQGEDPTSCYLWDICPNHEIRVGSNIIKSWKNLGFDICIWPKIYDDINSGGVIYYPEGCGTACYAEGSSLDMYLQKRHTEQSLTIESPQGWDLDKRIKVHMAAICASLDCLLSR